MRLTLLCLAIYLPFTIQTAQIPFVQNDLFDGDEPWDNLNARPGPDTTSHLIFETVNSLLQHWPNTRYRNGHNVVPATVPVGTLLYHGRVNSSLPDVPEWVSTDPEHAFPFCGDAGIPEQFGEQNTTGCWQLTLAASRPLKLLYFDGSSAANMKDGTLDAQDLLVWGKFDPARWLDDRGRIRALCDWGNELGIDGYVRMEMDFEVMLCDFNNGVELVSADYLTAWRLNYITPPLWRPTAHSILSNQESPLNIASPEDGPYLATIAHVLRFETVRAASWHNRYPGETRIVLDLTRFVSFYDTSIAPSLIPQRTGKERWDHRLQNISAVDLAAVTARLKAVLAPDYIQNNPGSGVDWQVLYRVLVDRYAERLEMLEYLLNTTTTANIAARAKTIQMQLRAMVTPYALYHARPTFVFKKSDSTSVGGQDDYVWAAPVWRGCATRHTAQIHTNAVLKLRLTPAEHLLLGALDGTNREICRSVVRMWAAGVEAGLDVQLPISRHRDASKNRADSEKTIARVVEGWHADTQALMAWLDWSVWVKCRPACSFEEICYMPTWPFFWDKTNQKEGEETGEPNLWKRPQPRCIRQFEPYSSL
ncbi:hypothetical protein C8R43DRAFT_640074 [Mycena crocata]|nr:hypothetical protein C8R43DRAFT_640074 [Mycena crocata]